MGDLIHIIGHKNPDTDSIMAAISYAELKRKLGIAAVACRIGEVNSETEFVLRKFQMEEPIYIENARVRLYDIPFDEPIKLTKNSTIKEAWNRICSFSGQNTGKNVSVSVVDHEDHLLGVVSLSDISKLLLNAKGNLAQLMAETSVDNICEVLDGSFLHRCTRFRKKGQVHLLSGKDVEKLDYDFKDSIVVVSDDLQTQRYVIDNGASCLILVETDIISRSMIKMAEEYGCDVIKTPMSMLQVARLIYQAISIGSIMHRQIVSFHNNEYIDDVYKKMSKTRFRSYPVLNSQGKVLGSISRYHLLNYPKKKFILVDHNEISQSIDYLKDAEVLEIVDHHRIGDVTTTYPVKFRNEIIGSTCSIIALMYQENQLKPDPKIAGCMCYAIISDTMNFNSPTCTPRDKEIAKWLADIAGLDLAQLAPEMFRQVATLKGKNLSEILYNDFKEYVIEGKRIAIGQINIADVTEMLAIRDEFLAYMRTINNANNFDLLLMCFTDVEGKGSNLLYVGNLAWVVDDAFRDQVQGEDYFVNGVISRKKQIVPGLSGALK